MILLRGLAIGILLICHYIVWINTGTWKDFFMYVAAMNLIGVLVGIPGGMLVGKSIKKSKQSKDRQERIDSLYNKNP
jgi:hypothetical protein